MRFEGFVGPTYESRSINADCQRSVNLFPEVIESGSGKARMVLYGTPGLIAFTTLPSSPIRGIWVNEYRLFVAAGNRIYEVFSNGTYTLLGTIDNSPLNLFGATIQNTPVLMYPNGGQLFIVSAGKAYCHTGVQLIEPVFTDTTEPVTAATGTFLDGYFIAQDSFTNKQFHWSELYNGLAWDPLDYATKEGHPDSLRRIFAHHEDLWLFGTETIEVWRANTNATAEGNPWERDPGAMIHLGCIAPWSVVRIGTHLAWIGGDARGMPVAYVAQGYEPRRVSTHAVEAKWATYSRALDAIAFSYRDHGHDFWQITFPAGDATWVYDLTTGLWHERAWRDPATGQLHRHRALYHGYVFDKHIVGDWQTGALYQMATSAYTDVGNPIERIRTAPHLGDEQLNMFYHRFQIDLETGEIANPEFSLETSNDGGHTWNAARTITAGAITNYRARAIWRRCGAARDRVFRVRSTAPMRHAWIDADLRVSRGIS